MEKNQSTEGIKVHDVISVNEHQRTAEDGTKRGYSWRQSGGVSLVTEVSPTTLVVLNPAMEEISYNIEDEEGDYYLTFSQASEIVYQNKIQELIEKRIEAYKETKKEIEKLMQWKHDFEHSISFIGKLIRFVKAK